MIYLDHASTSLPRLPSACAAAVEAMALANPGRGLHDAQSQARRMMEDARRWVSELAGGGVACFTSGATFALNQAILGLRSRPALVAADPLLHNAARRPLARLGAQVWTLPHDGVGRIDVARARADWAAGTTLLVVSHGSNVAGLLQPVADLVELAHARGAKVVVDCAQTAGLVAPLDIGPADAIAFSAHKALRGLPGAGALVVSADLELEPLVLGGTGGDAESLAMPAELPHRLEAGTPNLPGIAAFGEAARAAPARSDAFREAGLALREALRRAGVELLGEGELPVACFRVPGIPPSEVEHLLDRVFGLTVRAGLHCAPGAHHVLGTSALGAVRVSSGLDTSAAELDDLTRALHQLHHQMARTCS